MVDTSRFAAFVLGCVSCACTFAENVDTPKADVQQLERVRFGYEYTNDRYVVDVPSAEVPCKDDSTEPEVEASRKAEVWPSEDWLIQTLTANAKSESLDIKDVVATSSVNGCYLAWECKAPKALASTRTIKGAPTFIVYPRSLAPKGLKLKLLFSGKPEPWCIPVEHPPNEYDTYRAGVHREQLDIDGFAFEVRSREFEAGNGEVVLSVRNSGFAMQPFDNFSIAVCNPNACGATRVFQIWWASGEGNRWLIILGSDGSEVYVKHKDHFDQESGFYKGP